jgi:tetratricopeptide (TPR) repeat protein
LAGALNELGILYSYTGQFALAGRIFRRALALAVRLHGMAHSMVATIYRNLGGLERARGEFRIGEAAARRACEIRRELLGPDHPAAAADECALAELLDGLGRYKESRPIYERALAIFERHYASQHLEIANTLHNLASVDAAEGDLGIAEHRASRALAMKEKLLGKDHPGYVRTARHLEAIMRLREAGTSA